MNCAICGAENKPDAKFCTNCGKPLAAEAPAADKPAEAEQPSAAAPEAASAAPDPQLGEFLNKRRATTEQEREAAQSRAAVSGVDGYKSYTSDARANAYRSAARSAVSGDSTRDWAAWVGCIAGALSVLSGFLTVPGIVFGVCGIVFGILGRSSTQRGLALIGICLAGMGLLISLVMFALWRSLFGLLGQWILYQGSSLFRSW